MAIFNNSGNGILLNYDVIFKEGVFSKNELDTLNNSNNIIQIDTNLNGISILNEKQSLPESIRIKTRTGSTGAEANYGRILEYDCNKECGIAQNPETAKCIVVSYKIAANKIKQDDAEKTITITIPKFTNINVSSQDWIVGYGSSTPSQTSVYYEIGKFSLSNDISVDSNTIEIKVQELLDITNINKAAASYLVVSSGTQFKANPNNKGSFKLSGAITASAFSDLYYGSQLTTNSIYYQSKTYITKYMALSNNHIYKCVNYADCSSPRFLLYSEIPKEGLIGESVSWINDIRGEMFAVPGAKNGITYLAYSYTGSNEPIFEDYTLEYYLPKLYSNKSSDWESISDWFKVPHSDSQGNELYLTYNNLYDDLNNFDYVKENCSINKKLYIFEDGQYKEFTGLTQKRFTEQEFETLKENNVILQQDSKGKDTLVSNLDLYSDTYYYYEPVIVYYNKILINDWFNENCINTWEFSATEPYYNIVQNQQPYSITNPNKKTYWFQTGDNFQDQEFNAIKSDLNPLNTAITTISCYFDINPIIKNIGGYQILKDGEIEIIQLYFNGYIYKKEDNSYTIKNISRNTENITSISTLIEGKLTSITDKNVENIGPYAFYNYTPLEYVDFPNVETIDYGGGLKYTTAPFQNCVNLKTLKLPKWNYPHYTTTSSSYCVIGTSQNQNKSPFRTLSNLTEINYGVLSLPNAYTNSSGKVTKTNFVFYAPLVNNKLTKMTLSSCSIIGNNNFHKTNLQEVILGKENIDINIGQSAFAVCTNLETINLDAVTSLGNSAFYNCTNLKSIFNLSRIQSIGTQAFEGCASLETLHPMLSTVITINNRAFKGCESLKDIDAIGCTIFGAENSAFKWNYSTKTSYWNPIEGCKQLETLKLGVNDIIYNNFFNDATRKLEHLTTVAFPNVSDIEAGAFKDITSLENVIINIEEIKDETFKNTSIPSINEDENSGLYDLNLSIVGANAFAVDDKEKASLSIINFPKTWETKDVGVRFGQDAFKNAPLTKINIAQLHPEEVNQLVNNSAAGGAFTDNNGERAWNNYNLEYLTINNAEFILCDGTNNALITNTSNIKNTLQYFEADKMLQIKGFEDFKVLSELNCINANTISENGLANLTTLNNNDTIQINIDLQNDKEYSNYRIFNIPSISTIGKSAFENTNINLAYFPKVSNIGENAFKNSNIKNIYCGTKNETGFNIQYNMNSESLDIVLENGMDNDGNDIINLQQNNLYLEKDIIKTIGSNAFAQEIKDENSHLNLYLSPDITLSTKAFSNRIIDNLYFIDEDEEKETLLTINENAFFSCNFADDFILTLPKSFNIKNFAFRFDTIPSSITIETNDLDINDPTSSVYFNPYAFCDSYGTPISFGVYITNSIADDRQRIEQMCNEFEGDIKITIVNSEN